MEIDFDRKLGLAKKFEPRILPKETSFDQVAQSDLAVVRARTPNTKYKRHMKTEILSQIAISYTNKYKAFLSE